MLAQGTGAAPVHVLWPAARANAAHCCRCCRSRVWAQAATHESSDDDHHGDKDDDDDDDYDGDKLSKLLRTEGSI